MNRRRVILGAALFIAPIFAVVAACSFPDVSFGPPEPGGEEEAGPAEAAPPDAGGGASDSAREPELADAAFRDDATARVDASDCGVCDDCDNDGYLSVECDAGDDAGGEPLGDCDDFDPLRHPGRSWVAEKPIGHAGDWDCDGKVDRFHKTDLRCEGEYFLWALVGCSGGEGFLGDPGCGEEDFIYECKIVDGKCKAATTGKRTAVPCK